MDMTPKIRLGAGGGGKGAGTGGTDENPWFSAGGVNVFKGKAPNFTYKMAYVLALPVVAGILGAIINGLFHQKIEGLKDYYFPKTGDFDSHGKPLRLTLPTYMKDVFAFADHPGETVTNKLHPFLSTLAQMFNNRDYYGTEIRHADDPIMRQVIDELEYAGKQFAPFTLTNLAKSGANEASLPVKALGFVGFGQAPRRIGETPAERMVEDLQDAQRPTGTRTREQAAKAVLKQRVRIALRRGDEARVQELTGDGQLSAKDVQALRRESEMTPLQAAVSKLDLPSAAKVDEVASSSEKAELHPVLEKKLLAAQKANGGKPVAFGGFT